MRNLFSRNKTDINGIESEISVLLPEVIKEFHSASFQKIEKIAQYFDPEKNSLIDQFSDALLEKIQDVLTEPARIYGYYDNRPALERPGIYRTTSEIQYCGNSDKFRKACHTILSVIERKRAGKDIDCPMIPR